MLKVLLKILSIWNLNLAVLLYYSCFSKKPTRITDVIDKWQSEEKLSQVVVERIKFVKQLPDRIFLKIGIVLDIYDFNANRWPLHALLQTATHYKVSPKDILRDYEIVVTPFGDFHGGVYARRITSSFT